MPLKTSDKRFQPVPAEGYLHYLQQLIDSRDKKQRAVLARQYEDEMIAKILATREEVQNQKIARETGEQLLDVLSSTLACVRTLAEYADDADEHEPRQDDSDEEDILLADDPTLSLEDAYLDDWEPGQQQKVVSFPKEVLFDLLVEEAFLSESNKELFESIMRTGHLDLAVPVKVNWLGDILSLVNFVVLGYYLHLFKIDRKATATSKGDLRSRPIFEAAMRKTFLVRGKEIYEGITKFHIEPLEKEISRFLIEMREHNKKPIRPSGYREDLAELLGAFFEDEIITSTEKTRKKLNPDVGKLLSDLLESAD
jgi:hypothetical protein